MKSSESYFLCSGGGRNIDVRSTKPGCSTEGVVVSFIFKIIIIVVNY